jgi:hypothetical protein
VEERKIRTQEATLLASASPSPLASSPHMKKVVMGEEDVGGDAYEGEPSFSS